MKGLALLIALIATVLLVPRLGHRQIIGSHEAVFPIVARDIVERGAWMDAQLRGVPYRNKPPLYPWSIAALSWPRGRVTETTAGIPVVAAAIGIVVALCLLGLACGALVGVIVWRWRADVRGAFVIGGSIALSLVSACLIGLGVPSLLHAVKLDPKIAAGPVTLALADIFALGIYFTSAWLVLR